MAMENVAKKKKEEKGGGERSLLWIPGLSTLPPYTLRKSNGEVLSAVIV